MPKKQARRKVSATASPPMRVVQCRERNSRLASFSRYAALALKGASSALTLKDVLRLGCRSLNLKFMEVAAEGNPGLVIGFYGETGDEAEPESARRCESVQVATAEGRRLEIRYQIMPAMMLQGMSKEDAAEAAKLERQDIMACLANAFQGARTEKLSANAPDEESTAEMAVPDNVQDMSEIVSGAGTEERVKVSALTVD